MTPQAPRRPDYGVAILGAGLAGLSLAVRLTDPRFEGLRVLVEPRTRNQRDRTRSYWALRPHPFQAAVSGQWHQWAVAVPGREVVLKSRGPRCDSIQADAFYGLALGGVRSAPHIERCLGHAVAEAIPFWPTMGAAGRLAAGRTEWPRPAAG